METDPRFDSPSQPFRLAEPSYSLTIQGELVQLRYRDGLVHPPPRAKRSSIASLSPASRQRAYRALARVNWPDCMPGQFVTLTYPDDLIPHKPEVRTEQRARMQQYIDRFAKRPVPMFWRAEWEVRKSGMYYNSLIPHWHIMCLTINNLAKEQVREWWRTIIGSPPWVEVDVREIYGMGGCADRKSVV